MERSLVRHRDDVSGRAEARAPDPLPSPVSQLEALQRTAGNAAVARLLTSRRGGGAVLARKLDAKIEKFTLSQAPVTPARLREVLATIEDAWTKLSADEVQGSFADAEKVDRYRKQFATHLATALATINKDAPADPEQAGASFADVQAGASDLAKQLGTAIRDLSQMAGLINTAWDDWKKDDDEKAAQRAEEAALQESIAGFGQREKEARWQAEAEAEAATATPEGEVDDEDDERIDGFPHNGKHAPKKAWLKKAKVKGDEFPVKLLMSATEAKGKTAVYKTRDPVQVVAWENEARANGLVLSGDFTIVYGFQEDIGADHGEMTRFVRIDGDHGHPIVEDYQKLNTSFTAYVKKDVEDARAANNVAQLRRIYDFLRSLRLVPSQFGIKTEPPKPAQTPAPPQ